MFCAKCGNQLSDTSAKFCSSCGAPVAPAASADAPSATPPPAATASGASPAASPLATPMTGPAAAPSGKSAPWLKLILIVLALFLALGIAVAGVITYVAYRVKHKIEEATAEYGLDKPGKRAEKASGSGPSGATVQARDVCSLLSKQEVSQITGVVITSVQGDTSRCTYASATNEKVVEDTVNWEGGEMGYKLMVASMKFSGGGQGLVSVPGIGDEAVAISPGNATMNDFKKEAKTDPTGMLQGMVKLMGQPPLMFRKGDVYAAVGVSEAHDLDEAKKALATKIASRI